MDKKHLSDEILVAWIEKSLLKSKYNSVSEHLEHCDQCYLRYSNLLESIKLNKKASLEQIPTEIRDFAKEQLGLLDNQSIPKTEKESILSKIFNSILRPVPITAIAAIFVLLIIIFNNVEKSMKSPTYMVTSKEVLSPVLVHTENDSLVLTQSINVSNELYIINTDGDTIFTDDFSGFRFTYPIEIFDNNDIISIHISSHGVSILDTTLILD